MQRREEVRCFCRHKPLLGVLVRDAESFFFHVKVYKANRVYGEMKVHNGLFEITCRECFRVHLVHISSDPHNFTIAPARVGGMVDGLPTRSVASGT